MAFSFGAPATGSAPAPAPASSSFGAPAPAFGAPAANPAPAGGFSFGAPAAATPAAVPAAAGGGFSFGTPAAAAQVVGAPAVTFGGAATFRLIGASAATNTAVPAFGVTPAAAPARAAGGGLFGASSTAARSPQQPFTAPPPAPSRAAAGPAVENRGVGYEEEKDDSQDECWETEESDTDEILREDVTAYEVLGVATDANKHMIKKAYRAKNVRFHEDKCKLARAKDVRQRLYECYKMLMDTQRRAAYDEAMGLRKTVADIDGVLKDGAYGRLMRLVADADVPFDLVLPKIVVIGLESHGKSSLMERIARREVFPRGENFVTRMPIRLKMRRVGYENKVLLRCFRLARNNPQELEKKTYEIPEGGDLSEQIAEMIKRFVECVHNVDDGRRGRLILIDHEIEVEVRAPNVPDLELIDLPGLVAMPPDVAKDSLQLTKRFLGDPDTLVLCVVEDVGASIRASSALNLMGGGIADRTIVVLTKVDISPANPRRLAERLADPQELVGFRPHDVVPVINRDSLADRDDTCSLVEAFEREREKFAKWKEGMARMNLQPELPPENRLGVTAVLRSLNDLIEAHMRRTWVPKQLENARDRLAKTQEDTEKLGLPPGELDPKKVVGRVCQRMAAVLCTEQYVSSASQWQWADVPEAKELPRDYGRDGPGPRYQRALSRRRDKALWKKLMGGVPIRELTHQLIEKALSDGELPIKLDRLNDSFKQTLVTNANNNFQLEAVAEFLSKLSLPDDFMLNLKHNPRGNNSPRTVFEAVIDTVYELVLVPLSDRDFWATISLSFTEKPEAHQRREQLKAQVEALGRLIAKLEELEEAGA